MQNDCIRAITEQQSQHKKGTLEYLVAELLKDIASKNPSAGEILSRDLQVDKMNLSGAGKHLYEYAKSNKSGNSYGMDDEEARRLLKEFYCLPDEPERNSTISLLDLLT